MKTKIKIFLVTIFLTLSTSIFAYQLDLSGLNNSDDFVFNNAADNSVINSNYNHVYENYQSIENANNSMSFRFQDKLIDGGVTIQDSLTGNQGGAFNVSNSVSSSISPIQVISNSSSVSNAITISGSQVGN